MTRNAQKKARRAPPPAAPARRELTPRRVLRVAWMLRIGVPVLVLVSLPRVWQMWHDHRRTSAIVFGCCLLALLAGLAGFMPWFLRRAIRRQRETAP